MSSILASSFFHNEAYNANCPNECHKIDDGDEDDQNVFYNIYYEDDLTSNYAKSLELEVQVGH